MDLLSDAAESRLPPTVSTRSQQVFARFLLLILRISHHNARGRLSCVALLQDLDTLARASRAMESPASAADNSSHAISGSLEDVGRGKRKKTPSRRFECTPHPGGIVQDQLEQPHQVSVINTRGFGHVC